MLAACIVTSHKVVIVLVTSVSMSVCNVITFKSLEKERFLLFCWYILRGYRQRRRQVATAGGTNSGMGKRDTWRVQESEPIMEVQGTELSLFVCVLLCFVSVYCRRNSLPIPLSGAVAGYRSSSYMKVTGSNLWSKKALNSLVPQCKTSLQELRFCMYRR